MSTFALKTIALITMLFDHIGYVFGSVAWDVFPFNSIYLRLIGRIAFPIFAFSVVNGWKYTKSRSKYFQNLCLFAIISQIPFTLAFYGPNRSALLPDSNPFEFLFGSKMLIVSIACTFTYWYFGCRKKFDKSLFIVLFATLIPVFSFKFGHIWVLMRNLNVLYTFVVALVLIYTFERICSKSLRWWESLWLLGIAGLTAITYGQMADYGSYFGGIALIILLYILRNNNIHQSIAVVCWSAVYYGALRGIWFFALIAALSSILILFYNNKKGINTKAAKWMFYIFYPLHIFILGLINIYLKFH